MSFITDIENINYLNDLNNYRLQINDYINKKYTRLASLVVDQVPIDVWVIIFNLNQRSIDDLCKMKLVCKNWNMAIASVARIRINCSSKRIISLINETLGNKFKLLTSLELRGSIYVDLSQFYNLQKLYIFNRKTFNSNYTGFSSLVNLTHLTYKYANVRDLKQCIELPITHLDVSCVIIADFITEFKSLTHLTLGDLGFGCYTFPKISTLKRLTIIGWNTTPVYYQSCYIILISNNTRFSSNFIDGKPVGIGTTIIYKNKDGHYEKYIGEHKCDNLHIPKYHGYGTLEKNNKIYKGKFDNGILLVDDDHTITHGPTWS